MDIHAATVPEQLYLLELIRLLYIKNFIQLWLNDLTDSSQMLLEAKIIVDFISCKLNVKGYFRGKEYKL